MTPKRSGDSTNQSWFVIALLVASALINYVDRSNLSIAAPVLQHQLALSPIQLGSLLAAFSWTYALFQLTGFSGWLTDRFPVGQVMLGGYLAWSAATVLTGLLSSFYALFGARLLLGMGESIAYPCYSRILADLPQNLRGRANASIDAATKLGPSIGALIGGALLLRFGWRVLFISLGAGGLLWVAPWLKSMPGPTSAATPVDVADAASTGEILKMRAAWGSFVGHFCGNYTFYFLLTWLPHYSVTEAGLSIATTSRLTAFTFFLIASSTMIAGFVSDRLIARGLPVNGVRKSMVAGGLFVASLLFVIGLPHISHSTMLAMLFIACIGYGTFSSNHWAVSQTLAGPVMAGRWTGLQNGIGNLSGIAAPWLAGACVQFTGNSRAAFAVTGSVALIGAICWGIVVQKVEPVLWAKSRHNDGIFLVHSDAHSTAASIVDMKD